MLERFDLSVLGIKDEEIAREYHGAVIQGIIQAMRVEASEVISPNNLESLPSFKKESVKIRNDVLEEVTTLHEILLEQKTEK